MANNGNIALEVQKTECEAAITDIKNAASPPECKAFESVARGLVALLRCRVADIHIEQEKNSQSRAIRGAFWQTVTQKATSIAVILITLGFFFIAVQAKSLVKLLVEIVK